jgi:hypothetical protein
MCRHQNDFFCDTEFVFKRLVACTLNMNMLDFFAALLSCVHIGDSPRTRINEHLFDVIVRWGWEYQVDKLVCQPEHQSLRGSSPFLQVRQRRRVRTGWRWICWAETKRYRLKLAITIQETLEMLQ